MGMNDRGIWTSNPPSKKPEPHAGGNARANTIMCVRPPFVLTCTGDLKFKGNEPLTAHFLYYLLKPAVGKEVNPTSFLVTGFPPDNETWIHPSYQI